ncbi:hypothetical protein HK102_005041 [Quaeritorhiza haematococci]|nr:hypothetical protein HK102_005041 [Quaeritorhiza haematococci]
MVGQLERAIVVFQDNFEVLATSLGSLVRDDSATRWSSLSGGNTSDSTLVFDSIVVELMEGLRQEYKSTEKIPKAPQLKEVTFQGVRYVYGVMSWNVTSTDRWGIAVLAPREQIYGDIDRANNNAIIVVTVVTCGVVAIIGLIMWWVLRPLGKLAQGMERLTVFEFSALEDGNLLNIRSVVTEVWPCA